MRWLKALGDPGTRIGANTQVSTADGARIHGVPRPDFVMALGDRQTITGRGGADHLGTLGHDATIRGGPGGRPPPWGSGRDARGRGAEETSWSAPARE